MQHERQALLGRQRIQHHEQRQADRVGQHCTVFGVEFAFRIHDRIRQIGRQFLPTASPAVAQHVQADPQPPRWSARRRIGDTVRVDRSVLPLSRNHASCTAS